MSTKIQKKPSIFAGLRKFRKMESNLILVTEFPSDTSYFVKELDFVRDVNFYEGGREDDFIKNLIRMIQEYVIAFADFPNRKLFREKPTIPNPVLDELTHALENGPDNTKKVWGE